MSKDCFTSTGPSNSVGPMNNTVSPSAEFMAEASNLDPKPAWNKTQ